MGDGVDVKHADFMARGDFLEFLVEGHDLLMIFASHSRRDSGSARDIRNVRNHYGSFSIAPESAENLLVVFGKLFNGHAMSDVIDANAQSY